MDYDDRVSQILRDFRDNRKTRIHALHEYAKELLDAGEVQKAWQVLLSDN